MPEYIGWFLIIPIFMLLLLVINHIFIKKIIKQVSISLSLLSSISYLIFGILGIFYAYNNASSGISYPFISVSGIEFNLGFYLDLINTTLISVIEIITSVIFIYSIFYMENYSNKDFSKFYLLLNLFNFSILGLIYSPNLFQMLICWELLSATSYLLIGFDYKKNQVAEDSKRAFLINIVGDIALLIVFIIISIISCTLTNNKTLASIPIENLNIIVPTLLSGLHPIAYKLIALLLVFAGFIKSAQFPLNSWIINAMSAPTPVSALIHSSTLVMAGAFLVLRFFPLIAFDSISMKLMVYIGITTAILTSLSALVETNIKKILAYSTSAQLGLVFACIGSFNPIASIFFLISHAFIKVLLFLCAGFVIKFACNCKNILMYGNLRKHIPLASICFLIGALALSGIGFCGFSTKTIINNIFCTSPINMIVIGIIGTLTSLYIFRLYFIAFERKNNNDCYDFSIQRKISNSTITTMTIMLIILSFALPLGKICLLYFINLLMIPLAYYLYNTNLKLIKIPILHKVLKKGFYLDKIYRFMEDTIYKYFSMIFIFIDYFIIGGIEYIFQSSTLLISNIGHKLQTNNFQSYIVYGIWILLIIICLFLWLYTFIQKTFGV